jgi:hypothetical protein
MLQGKCYKKGNFLLKILMKSDDTLFINLEIWLACYSFFLIFVWFKHFECYKESVTREFGILMKSDGKFACNTLLVTLDIYQNVFGFLGYVTRNV